MSPYRIYIPRAPRWKRRPIALLKRINELNLEGIVFKHIPGPYRIDRDPHQFKYKFTHVSSFIVVKRNDKDSVDLAAYDDRNQLIDVGSVKIRNRLFSPILREGMIVDVRYAHAYPSHKLCQPRMISIRDDLQPNSCLLSPPQGAATMRSIWKGAISFLFVSIPVKVDNAIETSEKIQFNQLHGDDFGPIGYEKRCKKCNLVVSSDQIVKGYQHAPEQYVVVSPEEIASITPESHQSIEIIGFLKPRSHETHGTDRYRKSHFP